MAEFLPELRFWRFMSNPASVWDAVTPDNDNDLKMTQEGENGGIRPSVPELIRSLPASMVDAMHEAQASRTELPYRETVRALGRDEVEWRRGRISRLGGLKFAATTASNPDEILGDLQQAYPNEDCSVLRRKADATNVEGPAASMPRAGTLLSYRPGGVVSSSRPADSGRDRRAGQDARVVASNGWYRGWLGNPLESTKPPPSAKRRAAMDPNSPIVGPLPSVQYCDTGLPWSPASLRDIFMGMGVFASDKRQKTGTGNFRPVRSAFPQSYGVDDQLGDVDTIEGFRRAFPDDATVLDLAMMATTMADVANAIGLKSPHSGKRALELACVKLREFRIKEAA